MGKKKPSGQGDGGGRYQVPALSRGLKILEYLAAQSEGGSVAELASALKLPKPSVFRMLLTLEEQGYLKRLEGTSGYRLSRKLLSLGYAAVDAQGLVEQSIEVMRQLRDATQETVLLGVLSGSEGIVVEQAPGTHAVKVLVQVGHRFPLHTAAPGKALLAYLPEAEREAIMASLTFQVYTPRTIRSRSALREELERVRTAGVAYDRGEELDELRCAGAPVLDARGYPLAAIWVSGPASRIQAAQLERFGALTKAHAGLISKRFTG